MLCSAVLTTVGRVVIPFVVQQATDKGIGAEGGPDVGFVLRAIGLAAFVVLLTSLAQYAVNVRLFTAAESGLVGTGSAGSAPSNGCGQPTRRSAA